MQVKGYVNNHLNPGNPGKVNVIDKTKEKFIRPLSIKEALD